MNQGERMRVQETSLAKNRGGEEPTIIKKILKKNPKWWYDVHHFPLINYIYIFSFGGIIFIG